MQGRIRPSLSVLYRGGVLDCFSDWALDHFDRFILVERLPIGKCRQVRRSCFELEGAT
jgi:hypothetical protein